ncbi:MAG: sporulation protein [Planctomycetota bacterium]|nr:sporulation protein [Planctomycetota bacterium]
MGMWDGFKRTLAIGGAEIYIQTDRETQDQGSTVSGRVLLVGKDYELAGHSIQLDLVEFWTETRSSGFGKNRRTRTVTVTHTHDSRELAGDFVLKPGDERCFPFKLRLPPNARLSTGSTGWRLTVALDVPNAIDPTGTVTLEVVPAPALMAVVEACVGRLKFCYERAHWSRSNQATTLRLLPPEMLKGELDFIEFELRHDLDGGVEGSLHLDLQEKSLGDYLKAIVNYDQVSYDFTLPAARLWREDGGPNEAEIVEAVGAILKAALAKRGAS